MAANRVEVPENETCVRKFMTSGPGRAETLKACLETVQNGTFTGPIRGLARVEKVGASVV